MEKLAVESLIRELLSANRSCYGICVTSVAADLKAIDLEVRFLAGRRYCCYEFGCHFPMHSDAIIALSPAFPACLRVRWRCHIEKGAIFDLPGAKNGSYLSDALYYEQVTAPSSHL